MATTSTSSGPSGSSASSSTAAAELFDIAGLVAVITGGGSGVSLS
jgi:hypothetical protein